MQICVICKKQTKPQINKTQKPEQKQTPQEQQQPPTPRWQTPKTPKSKTPLSQVQMETRRINGSRSPGTEGSGKPSVVFFNEKTLANRVKCNKENWAPWAVLIKNIYPVTSVHNTLACLFLPTSFVF